MKVLQAGSDMRMYRLNIDRDKVEDMRSNVHEKNTKISGYVENIHPPKAMVGVQNSVGKKEIGANVLSGNSISADVILQLNRKNDIRILSYNKIGNVGRGAAVLSNWKITSLHEFASGNDIGDVGDGARFGVCLSEDE